MEGRDGFGRRNLMSELGDVVGVGPLAEDDDVKKELKKVGGALKRVNAKLVNLGFFELTRLPIRKAAELIRKATE